MPAPSKRLASQTFLLSWKSAGLFFVVALNYILLQNYTNIC
jgi:hypothetical protein